MFKTDCLDEEVEIFDLMANFDKYCEFLGWLDFRVSFLEDIEKTIFVSFPADQVGEVESR